MDISGMGRGQGGILVLRLCPQCPTYWAVAAVAALSSAASVPAHSSWMALLSALTTSRVPSNGARDRCRWLHSVTLLSGQFPLQPQSCPVFATDCPATKSLTLCACFLLMKSDNSRLLGHLPTCPGCFGSKRWTRSMINLDKSPTIFNKFLHEKVKENGLEKKVRNEGGERRWCPHLVKWSQARNVHGQ